MIWKRKAEEKVLEPVDLKTGIDLLLKQIEQANQLLNARPLKSKDLEVWNGRTREYLIRIYGERSPNVDTIVEASGDTPVWIFMPDDAAERYEASCLENKVKLLEGCVVALKRKDRESGGIISRGPVLAVASSAGAGPK
jgi:hypothetical protein